MHVQWDCKAVPAVPGVPLGAILHSFICSLLLQKAGGMNVLLLLSKISICHCFCEFFYPLQVLWKSH